MKSIPVNVMSDKPLKVIIKLVTPLLIVGLVSLLATVADQKIKAEKCVEIFKITGFTSVLVSLFTNFCGNVATAAWMKYSDRIIDDHEDKNKYFVNSIYSALIFQFVLTVAAICFADNILQIFNVPNEWYGITKEYFVVLTASSLFTSVCSYYICIINGIGSVTEIFIVNLINSCGLIIWALLFLVLLNLGVIGVALYTGSNALFIIALSFIILKRKRVITRTRLCKPDIKIIFTNIKYGLIISLDAVFCTLGYLAVSIQTNKYLSPDYIQVISVNIPLALPLSALGSSVIAFIPPNYNAGEKERVKSFLKISLIIAVVYGIISAVIYSAIGNYYFSGLFADKTVVLYGEHFWRLYGIGLIFCAVIYIIKFFFNATGYAKLGIFSGIAEFVGNIICAFYIIPNHGNIGNMLGYPLGWAFGAIVLTILYFCFKKKIYLNCK